MPVRLEPALQIWVERPEDFTDLSLEEGINALLEKYFSQQVVWIQDWLDADKNPDFKTEILFTSRRDQPIPVLHDQGAGTRDPAHLYQENAEDSEKAHGLGAQTHEGRNRQWLTDPHSRASRPRL